MLKAEDVHCGRPDEVWIVKFGNFEELCDRIAYTEEQRASVFSFFLGGEAKLFLKMTEAKRFLVFCSMLSELPWALKFVGISSLPEVACED
ncbi:hypothetical protein NDN08_004972 [Rhodosorus marinus]|uniref:Uncharacterized protein n=1 Tax=Rhodosorus marinus TaxID=101924 RepID=A0AAV8UIG4_9RHOD|nr:hypothetical protein NDN08_004972 [Rhodosorus marinus]